MIKIDYDKKSTEKMSDILVANYTAVMSEGKKDKYGKYEIPKFSVSDDVSIYDEETDILSRETILKTLNRYFPTLAIESIGFDKNEVMAVTKINGFVETVSYAFNDHRPLYLEATQIWILIAQGVAKHIDIHAERLRKTFVEHEGKEKIEVRRDGFVKGKPDNDWSEVFSEFSEKIRRRTKGEWAKLLSEGYSTTSDVQQAALDINLMDSMQHYFKYVVSSRCGIPCVQLEGKVNDWITLRKRVGELRKLDDDKHFGNWLDNLEPVIDEFVQAAKGVPNIKHWKNIYSLNNMSGGPFVNGWINAFFPYVYNRKKEFVPNIEFDCCTDDSYPSGVSSCPFVWNYFGESFSMRLNSLFVVELIGATGVRAGTIWMVGEEKNKKDIPSDSESESDE